jgi:Putative auto-transporter adhesin, head GIN domain
MRKILSLLIAVTVITTVTAQKTINDPNAEKRNLSGFHSINVSGGIDLYLSQGDETVVVSASEIKYRDRVKTEVVNGVLKIWYEWKPVNIQIGQNNRKLKAYVSAKTLEGLHASGGSDIILDGNIKTDKLNLHLSGGSDFNGTVNATELKAHASGGSDISISGTASSVYLDASGGSDIKGYGFITENCFVDASGGSDVYITVNKELNVEATGGSDVHYKGTGLIREIKNNGGSSVRKTSR